MQRQLSVADVDVTCRAAFARRGAQIECQVAADAHLRLRRDLVGDDVDEPADRIRAVEQRRRTANDLDLLRRRRVDRHAVIARLTREIAEALTVLKDQDSIAVEPSNDRTRRGRAKASCRNARLTLERRAERHLELFGQFLTRQNGCGLERIELTASIAAHRYDFLEVQIEINLDLDRRHPCHDLDFSAPRREALREHRQVVGARRDAIERKRPVGARCRLAAKFVDLYCGATKRGGIQ